MAKRRNGKSQKPDSRRRLPSVSALLELKDTKALIEDYSRPVALGALRAALDALRAQMAGIAESKIKKAGGEEQRGEEAGGAPEMREAPSAEAVLARAREIAAAEELHRMRRVVNATGIILHTGLGRAVLPERAAKALAAMNRPCNVQIDLDTGLRGRRGNAIERLLRRLTGAEAALVVNNNAAATLLILAALCQGREVIVSRGQLIEIGGSYRLPDCVHQSGAILVEVGTTNKTHLRDYENALTENTGAILHVNPSNYRVIGFSESVPLAELAGLRRGRPFFLLDDLGCGSLVATERWGLPHEPTVQESVAAGADVVCFSGDKMIGGPQAGIIAGKRELIDRIRKHPLARMLRVCKLTSLALEHTLRLFLDPDTLLESNPTLRMIALTEGELRARARRLRGRLLRAAPGWRIEIARGQSATGGGSLPDATLPTWLICVEAPGISADELAAMLRRNEPPVIARIEKDRVVMDPRTLMEGDDVIVAKAFEELPRRLPPPPPSWPRKEKHGD